MTYNRSNWRKGVRFMKERNKKLLKSAAMAALTAGAIYGINRLVFFVSTMKDILVSKEKSYYSWRFGNMYYSKQGEGRPVLLIHNPGSSGSDYEWNGIVERLSEDHTVYTIDLPGCGRSDKEKMVYTNYLYVQAVNDFVKHIIKARTDIITSGDSSSIAIMACHSEPSLYGKFIFINPEPLDHMVKCPKSWQKILCYFIQTPLIGTLYYVFTHSKFCIRQRFEKEYFYDRRNIQPDVVNSFYEAAHLGGFGARFAYASQTGYYTRINVVHALKKIDHSMYIIGGAGVIGIENTIEGYTHFNPAIEAIQIEKTKGMPHMENPSETVDICRLYLNN